VKSSGPNKGKDKKKLTKRYAGSSSMRGTVWDVTQKGEGDFNCLDGRGEGEETGRRQEG